MSNRGPRRPTPVGGRLLTALVLVLTGSLTFSSCTIPRESSIIPADAAKVLQAVTVTMSPDGTITAVNSQAVSTAAGASDAVTTTSSYAPADAAQQLPFRLLTAYRAGDKSGTDLAELAGHTGPVEIDVTVQNLTVKPEKVTYDVAGAARSQAALVGVPLTVVASVQLADTPSESVVTTGAAGTATTNGVLSQDAGGHAVVQWATILAPPQLGTTGTLRLVVDARNFKVPTFNVSVQPGLVADPSVSGLLDSAFAPGSSAQLALESRTIKLIGDVNVVLARASKAVSTVRTNLNDTSKTLGTKSVADLKSGTEGVATSMKALDARVKSLGTELSSSLESTQSSLLGLLDETVQSIDQVLGDTSQKPPEFTVKGADCGATVEVASGGSSVYGSLMEVVAQLDGYAGATGACRDAIKQHLLDSVGPKEPTGTTCPEPSATNSSVTCSLYGLKSAFSTIADKLVAHGDAAVAALDSKTMTNATAAFAALSTDVDAVVAQVGKVVKASPFGGVQSGLSALTPLLGTPGHPGSLQGDLADLSTQVDDIHDNAAKSRVAEEAILTQAGAAAEKLCALVTAGDLDATKVGDLLAELTDVDCEDHPLPGAPHSISRKVNDQLDAWDAVISATDTGASQGLGKTLATLASRLNDAQDKLAKALEAAGSGSGDLGAELADLSTRTASMADAKGDLKTPMDALQIQQTTLEGAVTGVFKTAADEAKAAAAGAVDDHVRTLTTNADVDATALSEMFERSRQGLTDAADKITASGATVVREQKGQLANAQSRASTSVTDQIGADLAVIADGVSSSSRDVDGASTLLTNDLRRVLLDLGERKVKGSGLLGAMATSAATSDSADYQLALASSTATSYANVRSSDVEGILLRQAQVEAALQALADLPAFKVEVPSGAEHRTVYSIQIGGTK